MVLGSVQTLLFMLYIIFASDRSERNGKIRGYVVIDIELRLGTLGTFFIFFMVVLSWPLAFYFKILMEHVKIVRRFFGIGPPPQTRTSQRESKNHFSRSMVHVASQRVSGIITPSRHRILSFHSNSPSQFNSMRTHIHSPSMRKFSHADIGCAIESKPRISEALTIPENNAVDRVPSGSISPMFPSRRSMRTYKTQPDRAGSPPALGSVTDRNSGSSGNKTSSHLENHP
ncbi:hypothetical protein AAMO2058_000092100 [Amorphochlora amoebiformis]